MRLLAICTLVCGVFAGSAIAGPIAYANTSQGQFGVVDLSNGSFSAIGNLSATLVGLGESGGVLYGLDSTGNLVSVNTATAATTILGNTGIPTATVFASLTSGALFAVDDSWRLWSIDPVKVAATSIGTINVNNTALPSRNGNGYADSLAGDANSLYFTLDLWVTTPGDVLPSTLYKIDPATGAATVVGLTNQEDLVGSTFAGGSLYAFTGSYVSLPHKIVTLDTSTAATTFKTTVAPGIDSLYGAVAADVISTPEPGTVSLAGLALAALWCARRRR